MLGKRLQSKLDSLKLVTLVTRANALALEIPAIAAYPILLSHRDRKEEQRRAKREKQKASAAWFESLDFREIFRGLYMSQQVRWDAKGRVRKGMPGAWSKYAAGWAGLAAPPPDTEMSAARALLKFSQFPWPMLDAPRKPAHITFRAVRLFLLSQHCPCSASTPDAVARIREALARFDGAQAYEARLVEKDRVKVLDGLREVREILKELLDHMEEGKEGGDENMETTLTTRDSLQYYSG